VFHEKSKTGLGQHIGENIYFGVNYYLNVWVKERVWGNKQNNFLHLFSKLYTIFQN